MEALSARCRRLFPFLILFTLVAACAEGVDDIENPDGKVQPLEVVDTSPADGATETNVATAVVAEFNQDMSGSSLKDGDFTVQAYTALTDETLNVEGNVLSDGTRMMFLPSAALQPGQTYTARIRKGLSDGNGHSLKREYAWSFTIASTNNLPYDPPPPEPAPDPAPQPNPVQEPIPEPAPEPTPDPTPEPAPEPLPDPAPEPTPDPPPVPPLGVTTTNPVDGASGVALDVAISALFNQDLGNWQMGPDDFYLCDSNGVRVLSTIQTSDGSTMVLQPAASLIPNELYTGTIGTGLIAGNGASLAEPYQWSFRTGLNAGVAVNSHESGDVISGSIQLSGAAAPAIQAVEVSVGYNNYSRAAGTTAWQFEIDSTALPDGATSILVRGQNADGQYTGETEIVVFIDNDPSELAWHPMALGPVQSPLFAAWGTAADNVYAAGGSVDSPLAVILNYNSAQWSPLIDSWNFNLALTGIWGTSADNFYVVGGGMLITGMILHYQSGQWTEELRGAFSDVWGSSGSDVYVVGSGGVFHFDGDAWSQVDVGYQLHFRAVWGRNAEDVYVVGYSGYTDVVLHFDGTQWTNQLDGSGFSGLFLNDIWGDQNEMYAVGTSSRVLHHDGTSWQEVNTGLTLDPLYAVTGVSDLVFAVSNMYSGRSKLLRFDGVTWTEDKTLSGVDLQGLWGTAEAGLFAVGSAGTRNVQSTIYYLPPSVFAVQPEPVDPPPPPPPPPPAPGPICPAIVGGCECPPGQLCIADVQ